MKSIIHATLRSSAASCALVALVAAAPARADISLNSSMSGPTDYTPGADGTYEISIDNTGDMAETGVTVSTSFPAGSAVSAASCVEVGTGTSCDSTIAGGELDTAASEIAPGGSITYTLTVDFDPDLALDPLTASATITSSDSSQSSTENASSTLKRVSDLSVTKSASATAYTPGTSVNDLFTLAVTNNGPSDSVDVVLADTAPAGMTITGWNCTPTADCPTDSGTGNLSETLAIAAGDTLTYTLDASFASSLQTDTLVNTAILTVPAGLNDPDTGDQSADASLDRDARVDLSVAFPGTGLPSTYIPGRTGQSISFAVSNAGPSDSFGAQLPLVWTDAVSNAQWSCDPAAACTPSSGNGDATLDIDLVDGGSVTVNATLDFDSGARDDLTLAPAASAPGSETDTETGNNQDSLTLTVDRRADIRVTKTASSETVNPGASFTYDIEIANLGPSDLGPDPDDPATVEEIGLLLDDAFPAGLLGDLQQCANADLPCWRVCASDQAVPGNYDPDNCPTTVVEGSGNLDDQAIALAAGSATTLRAFVRTEGGTTGELTNTASVRLDDGPDAQVDEMTSGGGTDSSQVVTTIELSTDIFVSKDDGTSKAVAGETHSYTIEAVNNGFVTANNVEVSDPFPLFDAGAFPGQADNAGFIPGSVSWQCRAFDGACCNTNSTNCGAVDPTAPVTTDILSNGIDLPGQSRVEITVTGTLDPRSTGTLVNEASLTLPAGVEDPDPANNTAVDADTSIVAQAALSVDKSLVSLTGTGENADLPPFTLVYSIVVGNDGPSFVAGATVSDPLSADAFDRSTATWTCSVVNNPDQTRCAEASGAGPLAADVDLDPGGVVEFELTVETIDNPVGEVRNDVTVSSTAGIASGFEVTSLIGQARLTIDKTDNRASIAPGDAIDYIIRVENEGPDDVFGARVVDDFPDAIDSLTWSCEATTPVPGDLAFLQLAGGVDTAGNALVTSADGRHVYVAGTPEDSVFVYDRNNVPGAKFGEVVLLETEIDGIDDGGDSGPAVTGMNGPLDIVISPDGLNVYVLSWDVDDGASLTAFSRSADPLAPSFGELTFLASLSDGLPMQPQSLAMNNEHLYVAGIGDPDGVANNLDSLISVFERDALTGVPAHAFNETENLPGALDSIVLDPTGVWLFAGGDSLAMYSIEPEQGELPAGRLALQAELSVGSGIGNLTVAGDAPHLYGKSPDGGTARLVMVRYLDADANPILDQRFVNTAADMILPAGLGDPLAGPGGISIAPDGEHLAGVSFDNDALYTFRRDPVSGGLSFAELFAKDRPTAGANRGLEQAADVVFAPDGRHLLVAAGASAELTNPPLAVYSRRAPDPLFAFVEADRDGEGGITDLRAPNDVAVSPDGAHVYTVSLPDNALLKFDRFPRLGLDDDSLGMHLQFDRAWFDGVDGVGGLVQPRRVLISPDGKSVFVTSEQENSLAVFDRDDDAESPAFGSLTFRQLFVDGSGGVEGLAGAQGMAMDAAGRHLYVAGSFGASIARFVRAPDGSLTFAERVVGGTDGVAGLSGIRDLAMTADGTQLLGVSTLSNALVVFDRDTDSGSDSFGRLTFVQDQRSSIGERPVALAIAGDGAHVYVAGQNSNSLTVLRRVTDPASSAFGQVQPLNVLTSGSEGIEFMNGPRDVEVSPDGKRIYVAAEFSNAVLVFDRDLNAGGSRFGLASLVETRRDSVRGVDGIAQVRAVAISGDSRNVYGAGFGDAALASFRLGIGSLCTAGGSGNIDDRVDLGAGGTIVYRATGVVRPDAAGTLDNTASVSVPDTFVALDSQAGCPDGADYCESDSTTLIPEGDVDIVKTSDQVSVTAGETARYTVTITNAGPSSLVHEPGFPLTVSDPLDSNDSFVPGSAVWTCEAAGSGSLEFLRAWRNLDPADNTTGPFDRLAGITGLALVPETTGPWLAGASVLDDAVSVFGRDPVTGDLLTQASIRSGESLDGQVVDSLDGAQALAASADGRFLYVASRVSDSITVLSLAEGAGGEPVLGLVQIVDGLTGLDQALHLALSPDPDQASLYVAGANDDAVAAFARDPVNGTLTWIASVREGIDAVTGLTDVAHVVVSPDGENVYALSPTSASIAMFDRDPATGGLSFRRSYDELDFSIGLAGASSAVFDGAGRFLYVAAGQENRILVLERDTGSTATRGELTLRSSVEQDSGGVNGLTGVSRLAMTADGVHLYATSPLASTIAWFVRDAADGSLAFGGLRGNEGGQISGLGGATGIAVDEGLDQVLVAGTMDAAVSQFRRQADSFCPASGTGELVDVPFNIGAGGRVTFTIEVEVAGDATGTVDNTATLQAARDPVSPTQDSVDSTVVSAEADLAITKTDGLSEFDGLAGASAVAATNTHLYIAAPDDDALGVLARTVDPGGPAHGRIDFVEALRAGEGSVEGVNGVADLAVAGDGAHVYAVSPVDNALTTFKRDPLTGQLAFAAIDQNGVFGVDGLAGAGALALSPDDAHVYVTGRFANAIATFAREADPDSPDFGVPTFLEFDQNGVGGVAGLGEPVAVAVSPDGLNVYVLAAEVDSLVVFGRNRTEASANFGRLSYLEHLTNNVDGVAGLGGVRDLVVGADGAFVYALGGETGTLARFARDPSTGELTFVDFKQDGIGDTIGLTGAESLLLDGESGTLYVAGAAAASIVRFDVDPDTGALSFADQVANGDPAPLTGGEVFGLEGVSGLALTDDGDHLYAASGGRDAALAFRRPAGSSALDFQQILIDGLGGVAPGVAVEYVITVENAGPSDAPEARVVDQFPDSFESVQWTCSPAQGTGAQCLDGGTGDVDTLVSLPAGGRITIRASGVIASGATGRLVNTATVSGVGVSDPIVANNSATDDDTVLSPAADLTVTLDNGADESTPGDETTWDVVVSNNGPSSVRGVFVDDLLPPALYRTAWSCTPEPAAGVLSEPGPLDAGLVPAALAIASDGRVAYAAGGDAVEVFARDPLTGDLTPMQLIEQGADGVTGIRNASDLVVTPDGRFVYVAGADSDAIALFEWVDEELRFVTAWQDGLDGIEGIGGVDRLLLSPEGGHLYAAGALDGALAIFAVDSTDGRLTQSGLVSQGVDGLNGLTDLAWAADGDVLLAVAATNRSLAIFERVASTGALSQADVLLNDDLLGSAAEGALLDPQAVIEAGDEVLVATPGTDRLGRFALIPADPDVPEATVTLMALGAIDSTVLGSPLTAPVDLQFDPDQARLYVATAEGLVLLNLLGAQPALLESYPGTAFAVLDGLARLELSPGPRHLYTLGARADGEIAVWARERGSRCALAGAGGIGRQQVDIVAGGRLVYTVSGGIQPNAAGELRYTVSVDNPAVGQELNPADNEATDVDTLVPGPDLGTAKRVLTDPVVAGLPVDWEIDLINAGLSDAAAAMLLDAPPVFPDSGSGVLAGSGSWSCRVNEPLSPATAFPAPHPISAIEAGPLGRYVYATSAAADALHVFPIAGDGSLAPPLTVADGDVLPGGTVTGLAGASDVAVSDDGLHVYVTGRTGDSLVVFGREEIGEPLDWIETFTTTVPLTADAVAGLRGARDVALSSDQRFVFVAGSVSDAIAVFERNRLTGTLNFVERVSDGIGTIVPEFNVIQGVRTLHPALDGADLYAVAADSEALTRFSVNAESGMLTFESVWREGDGGLPALAGLRDLDAAPGDTHLYALVDAGVLVLRRGDGGSLIFEGLFDAFPDPVETVALEVDLSGSRAYLLADSATGPVIHVLRRDWTDGSLELWFTQAIEGSAPAALLQVGDGRQLYAAAAVDALLRFDEQALSRCLTSQQTADAIATEVDLGAGGWSAFDLSAIVHPSARGELTNTVEAVPATGADPFPDDNTASASAEIDVVSDIAVTKTGPAEAVAGTEIGYQITVTNIGPSDALGIVVTDLAPAELEQIEWTCSPSAGSTCPSTGVGPPDFSADVLVGGQLDITLNAIIDPSLIGELINVVLLTPEPDSTDPTPDDQRAEVVTNVIARADVAVTKTTLTAPVVAGLPARYRLEAVNDGPSDAPEVRLVDGLPAALADPVWSCSAAGGATCPAGGSGDIDSSVAMPAGGSVAIEVSGTVIPGASADLVNSFSAEVAPPVVDPDTGNNVDQVTDAVVVRPDIALALEAGFNPFDPASPIELPIEVRVSNAGPSDGRNIEVLLNLTAPVVQTSPGCTQPAPDRIRCLISQLAPGASRAVPVTLAALPGAPGELIISGNATTSGNDPDLANNADSVRIELVSGIDLATTVDNGFTWLSPGQRVRYEIRVVNAGSVDAPFADIEAPVPTELLDARWTCQASGGASCAPAGTNDVLDTVELPAGGSVVYLLDGQVDPALDLSVPQSVMLSATASTSPPDDDFNTVNNVAADQDEVRLVIFRDGFESVAPSSIETVSVAAGAQECVQFALDGATARGMQRGRIVNAQAADGTRILWLDLTRSDGRIWLSAGNLGRTGAATSDWHAWPAGSAVATLRAAPDRVTLHFGQATAWTSAVSLPSPIGRVTRTAAGTSATPISNGAPAIQVKACPGTQSQSFNGVQE